MSIYANVKNLIEEIHEINSDVLIVSACKQRTPEEIMQAKEAGITVFAENRVQEYMSKKDYVDITWHFIGRLQSNKAKYIVGEVKVIHSCDSISLANEINKCAKKKNVVQDVLIQINIGEEESKGGANITAFNELYTHCMALENVRVVGIMTVMPKNAERALYLEMKDIFDNLKKDNDEIKYLSVGMSNDYKIAIECGANVVRIGTKIFGERKY